MDNNLGNGDNTTDCPRPSVEGVQLCEICRQRPCYFLQIKPRIMEQHIENPPDDGLDLAARNSASRKKAYKLATMYIHGVLGAGNRMRLPSCVEDGVRALFPPVDGIVMGFREEWIFIFRSVKSVGRVLVEYVRIYPRI